MILGLIQEAQANGARLDRSCEIVGISVRAVQRWQRYPEGGDDAREGPLTAPANKLTGEERQRALDVLNSPEYRNLPPKAIVPKLADSGEYVASESTMYRILKAEKMDTHRSAAKPPRKHKPRELPAKGPNEVLSWDITYLRAPVVGQFFYLYMIMDIWSRKIVGWSVEETEDGSFATRLFARVLNQMCLAGIRLIRTHVHADNGSPMKASTLLALFYSLGISTSWSRPSVSNDNPFSESLFRLVKYRPEYPTKPFASIEAARLWVERFAAWYNTEHLHSSIRFVTPQDRHAGNEAAILKQRERVYEAARRRNPLRWSGNMRNWTPIQTVYLNPDDRGNMVTVGQSATGIPALT